MPDGQIFEEPRKSWLHRLADGLGGRKPRTVRRREQLSLTVPAAKGAAVQAAIEQWLQGHGVAATLVAADAGDGKTTLRAKLDEAEASKLDLSAEAVQAELQAVLEAAIR